MTTIMTNIRFPSHLLGVIGTVLLATPVAAQDTFAQRMYAPPGTFFLNSNDDRELIRYSTPRDVRLCIREPRTVVGTERQYAVRITWDRTNSVILYPGNCMFFDARQVSLKPANELPGGVVLRGEVETEQALQD